jgi:hypothetical protein
MFGLSWRIHMMTSVILTILSFRFWPRIDVGGHIESPFIYDVPCTYIADIFVKSSPA